MIRLIKQDNNLHRLEVMTNKSNITIWFSYETPIAYAPHYNRGLYKNMDKVLTKNIWSSTTGQHLNSIDKEATRVETEEFTKRLDEMI